jgi:flagellar L-ring protein precursor FlgH
MQQINSRIISLLLTCTALSGCANILGQLDHINQPPPMAEVVNPQEKPEYQPMTWPMPETQPPPKQYANSLWQPGARAFFRDGRAARVGDILKVRVKINDKLQFNNQTQAKRETENTATADAAYGLERRLQLLPLLPGGAPNPAALLDITSDSDTKGTGVIQRQDIVTTQVAVMVTQMLPNGNMVIEGKQELTMNKDVREVAVKGVIRPQDIDSSNTIDSTQIAEARITYSGRGQLQNAQQPRWGTQVMDIVAPF